MEAKEDRWLTIKGAVEYLDNPDITERWIRRQINSGGLPYKNPTGRRVFIRQSDLEDFIENGPPDRDTQWD